MEKLTSGVLKGRFLNRCLLPLCLCLSSGSESDHCWINTQIRAALCSPSHSPPIGVVSGCGWGMPECARLCMCAKRGQFFTHVRFLGGVRSCLKSRMALWLGAGDSPCSNTPSSKNRTRKRNRRPSGGLCYQSLANKNAPDWGVKSQTKAKGVFDSF